MITNSIRLHHLAIDAAIIDLDGTLIDTRGDFVVALTGMLADLPLPAAAPRQVDRAVVERFVGKGSEHLIDSVLNHVLASTNADIDAIDIEALRVAAWQAYQARYLAINGRHAQVYPGVAEGLEGLRRAGVPMACLTNKPTAFAVPLLAAKGLDRYFQAVFGGDAFARKKPDPLPLLKACEALGTLPQRTLMVGDSTNDAQAARAAGCPVLLVTYGYNHGEPIRAVDADGYTDSLAGLAAVPGPR